MNVQGVGWRGAHTKLFPSKAFDRGYAHSTLTPVVGGDPVEVDSEVVVILRRQAAGAWKIARTIAVLR